MKKLYEKSELWFAIFWIVLYVMVMGNLRNNFGDEGIYSALGSFIIAFILSAFIIKNNLQKKYGFIRWKNSRKYLYFIPFFILGSVNLWFGIEIRYTFMSQIISLCTMLFVGYIEEILFRGLLFKAIEKENAREAIIISAVTFGAGHIVNLLTGQASMDTILQMCYAIAIGFSFVMVFYKSGSLWPCILCHCAIDVLSKFCNETYLNQIGNMAQIIVSLIVIIVAGSYSIYLKKLSND